MSHVGKLFTSVLNTRLMNWCKENSILTGTIWMYSCVWNLRRHLCPLFIITKTLRKGKRLYCCFVDYVKAFDSDSHYILWQKLLKCGISDNLLILIKSMYSKHRCMGHGFRFLLPPFSLLPPFFKIFIIIPFSKFS